MEKSGDDGEPGTPGQPGPTGNGIASTSKTGTSGLVDTYTITYTDGRIETFTVTNGRDGTNGTNGTNGQDGYTPQRGTDYWTSSDIATIESYCDDYIDTHITQAIGGAY